jgi:hypothetical protein
MLIDPWFFQFDNFSITDCSFDNAGWNINIPEEGSEKPEVTGSVTNFKIVNCFFQQGFKDPSCSIAMGGSGSIIGCDFVSHNEPGSFFPQILFNALWSPATWRIIGNHFKTSPNNDHPTIDIKGVNSQAVIIGNHYEAVESVFDYSPPEVGKRPLLRFVRLLDTEPSSHVIHSNIGDGQVYLDIAGTFSWVDVSPGIPVTLGSPTTKERNVEVDNKDLTSKFKVISFGTDLKPLLYYGVSSTSASQVDYQVEVSFQWDAGSWWISDKTSTEFTINWTNPPTEGDVNCKLLDWTLHL